ncbi:MAG: TlpA disulfide reductase family protein [Bacteroidota bacterium]
MKKVFILLFITLLTKISSAQNDLIKCAEKEFLNMSDTAFFKGANDVTKLLREWHDRVLGKEMPDFSVTSIFGQKIETEKLRDKIIVLDFWMIDCYPCIAELPAFNQLVEEYKKSNVVFLAITFETLKRLNTDFFPKYKFDFNLVSDAKNIIDLFGGSGYPKTFVIDKTGKIREAWPGGLMNEKNKDDMYLNIKPIIDELLKAE